MIPATQTGVWILYIWIFVLLWKAACLQGADSKRSRYAVKESSDQPLSRHKRELQENSMIFHGPDVSTNTKIVVKKAQPVSENYAKITNEGKKSFKRELQEKSIIVHGPDESTNTKTVVKKAQPVAENYAKNTNKGKGSFAEIVEIAKKDILSKAKNVPLPQVHNRAEEIIEIAVDYSTSKRKQSEKQIIKPTDKSSDTDTNEQASERNSKKNEVTQNKKAQLKKDEPPTDSKSKTSSEAVTSSVDNNAKSNDELKFMPKEDRNKSVQELRPISAENEGKHSSELKIAKSQNKDKTSEELKLLPKEELIVRPKEKKQTISSESHMKNDGSTAVVEMTKKTVIKPSNDVQKFEKSSNITSHSSKPSNNTIVFEKRPKISWNKNNNTLTYEKSPITDKDKQSLVLLKNVTREADEIQKRLKTQKLKLKSYIEALRNITSKKIASDELKTNYTQSVKEKVKDILNPKRRLQNSTKQEKGHKDEHKPNHFLAKDIEDTLRARVDMNGLKKSEQFWDKKGEDREEPYLNNEAHHDMSDFYQIVEDNEEEEEEEEITTTEADISSLLGEIEVTTDLPHGETEEHLNDLHQTKLDEVQVTRDRLKSRTEHEMLLINQMVSGRIHGNILAPPPERCSVTANMKRYRPPEDEMKEDESTLYRVDLQPENDKNLEGGPMNYLQDYKNPCWLSKITDDKGGLWYDYTESGLTYKRMSFLYEMRLSKESNWRMRCLPYLFLVGVTKSGTTDLYTRLMGHPEIMRPGHKEPMWWNRLTLGMAQSLRKPFRYYLDFFDEAAELIRRKVVMRDDKPYHPSITVDATPANLWDYDCWTDIPGNRGLSEPKYTLAHSIKKLVPNARILMILRQPTDRLYSQYRMKSHMEPSATFHKQVEEALVNFNECLETRSMRSCAYDYQISKHEFGSPGGVFLRASLYYVFVKDWLDVFPPEQVKVIRTEDYQNNTAETLTEVFDFLGLSELPKDRLNAIVKQREVNTKMDHRDRSLEPIIPETQKLLDDFFRPYNKQLAKLLHDKRFKWNDVRK